MLKRLIANVSARVAEYVANKFTVMQPACVGPFYEPEELDEK